MPYRWRSWERRRTCRDDWFPFLPWFPQAADLPGVRLWRIERALWRLVRKPVLSPLPYMKFCFRNFWNLLCHFFYSIGIFYRNLLWFPMNLFEIWQSIFFYGIVCSVPLEVDRYLVSLLVFKTSVGRVERPRWVRFSHTFAKYPGKFTVIEAVRFSGGFFFI